MALPRDLSGTADWPDEILEVVKAEWDIRWRIVEPGEPGEYDPVSDTTTGGTEPTVFLDWRNGRAQNMLNPTKRAEDWGTAIERRYLFHGEILSTDPSIPLGKMIECEYLPGKKKRDPEIERLFFRVIGASNSSHAAVRTVYAVTDMARK